MYKNTKPLPDSFKIKVNPEQSRVLQEHLFSNGKYWMSGDNNVKGTENKYLYFTGGIGITILSERVDFNNHSRLYFKGHKNPRIRFKDYFAKEIFTLPEKWCIEVTQDNCKELNVWYHRNWKRYSDYKDCYYVHIKDDKKTYFYSDGNFYPDPYGHSTFEHIKSYDLITTEQFRKQFGTITETKAEIEAIESNLEFWKKQAKHQRQRCSELRREKWEMSKQIESLKTTIEAIKEVIQDNPIIKK